MRTEDDLRDALQLFSDAAGPTQLEPKKNRPRRTVVLVAVAATVAAAIAIPLAVKGHNTPPPADSVSGRRTPFKVNLPTGWQQVTTTMAATNSWVTIRGPQRQGCVITAYQRGTFDPATIGVPKEALTVGGRPGYSGVLPADPQAGLPAMRATFWEYGTNGWAVARCGGGNSGPPAGIGSPEDQLNRQVALTADFATAPQLRSPVAFGYLPDGFEVAQISRLSGVSNGVQIKLVRRSAARPEVISLAFEWPLTIPASPGQVVTINGRQAKIVNGNSLTINFEGYGFALDAQLAKLTDPKAELISITKALKLVDPRDQSTWFPAQVGLP